MKTIAVVSRVRALLLAPVLCCCTGIATAQEGLASPTLAAQAWLLMDYQSGQVLAEGNADAPMDPASLSKIMTSYVVGRALSSGALRGDDKVTVEADAWAAGNPRLHGSSLMFLQPGERVSVEQLNQGMVIASGNDACIALADYIAGSQEGFVTLMNEQAQRLGLSNTTFKTVHGLEAPGQVSTARDMAHLSRALIAEQPEEYALHKEKAFSYNKIHQFNRNRLLWSSSLAVDGLRTGNSSAGGYSLVASATLGEQRLISVVMGASSDRLRFQESVKLLKWGFRSFESVNPVKPDDVFSTQRVWFGTARTVNLNAGTHGAITLPYGSASQLQLSVELDQPQLQAPLSAGQVVGRINYRIGERSVAQKPLQVMADVEQGGLLSRLWDYLLLKLYLWLGVCIACAA